MTRFARAKGSKSSNERTPEEATSWSEMRNFMLLKKSNESDEQPAQKEEVEIDAPKKTEWASLGDDTVGESLLQLRQHSNGLEENKKKKASNNFKLNSVGNGELKSKKEMKKLKDSDLKKAGSEEKVIRKGKKRKLGEGDEISESASPKKKKFMKNKEENFGWNKKTEQAEVRDKKDSRKDKNLKKTKKSEYLKKKSEDKRNSKSGTGKQLKKEKKFKNKKFQNKNPDVEELIINGEKLPIVKFQGFYVTLDDAERLKKLRSELLQEGIPKSQLEAAIKLERRRAEKALSRLKKSVCFHCRNHGHLLSNCPNLVEKENTGTGICYKCGSTEHSAVECKVIRGTNYQFAECFICKEQGHIARQCPDNPRGLYPQGGACRECGDVTHLKKDCPRVQAQKAEEAIRVGIRNDRDLECLDEEIASREKQKSKKNSKKNSVVKF